MYRKLIIVFHLILSGLLTGCYPTENATKEKTSERESIVVSKYFPSVGMNRTYIQYGSTGEKLIANDVVKTEVDSTGKESLYIYEEGGLAVEKLTEYEVTEDSIRVVHITNPLINNSVDELELSNKGSWNVGDSDNSIRHLTKLNLEISVPAGTFHDCIEVTQITKTDKEINTIIYYYAPNIGIIKTVWELGDEKFTSTELQSFSNGIGKSKEETSTESPSPKFQSGKLPPDSNMTSSLNVNDYINKVNQLSFEQVEYYLLHRPTFEEKNNDTILSFTDDIKIRCDKYGYIKDLTMQQKSPLTEEKLFYIQWLILGLDSEITIDEVNEIIFPKEPNQTYKVGEFNVGIKADANGFIFKATPNNL